MFENRGNDAGQPGGWLKRMLRASSPDARADGVDALCRQGDEAERSGRYDEAAQLYRQALDRRPGDAHVCALLAGALNKAKRPRDAEAVLLAGVAAKPDHGPMLIELAASLMQQNRWEQALPHLERAAKLAPDMGEPHFGLGAVQLELGKVDEAIASFRRAHELMPDHAGVHSGLAFIQNYSAGPTPEQILAEHKRYGDRHGMPVSAPPPDRSWPRRLRIGYVSPDFRRHVVSTFMLPIIARHDRERFEVYCYYVFEEADQVTDGFIELADRWRHCRGTPREIFERIREDRIDILVDLAGHSRQNALEVFALRPAPVQVSYLGYPNTTGLQAIDYRITDAKADPADADAHYVEKLVRLPRSFVCFRPGPGMEVGPLPVGQGAPFTFGSFNNILKVSPPFVRAAARILKAVPGSRLLLKDKRLAARGTQRNLEAAFAQHGIEPSRLQLKGWEPTAQSHLKTYDAVDVALDTFPYNGTTTTCEALWMGVPVVSLYGDRHAGRVGASLLESVGLAEFLARTEDEYVAIAAGLASDPARLASLRAGMRARLQASPVMDERGFVRELEQCYLDMWNEKLAEARREPWDGEAVRGEVAAVRAAGRTADAIAGCVRILRRLPGDAAALQTLWDLCHEAGEHAVAIEHLGAALGADPESPRLHYMLGCTLEDAGRFAEAAASFRRALEIDPAHAKAANNLGCMLEMVGDAEGAKRSYDTAIRADPGLAMAFANRGNLHRRAGRFAEAERDLAAAIRIDGSRAEWHDALGECLAAQERLDEAERAQRAGLQADPDSHTLHRGLGLTLVRLGRTAEAEASFRRALELAPDDSEAHSALLQLLQYAKGNDAAALSREHEAWAARHAASITPLLEWPSAGLEPQRKIRVGYVLPAARALVPSLVSLLAHHDRKRFRVYCYSPVAPASPEALAARLRDRVDEWRDIHSLGDAQAARLVREDAIEILVDLAGHADKGRPLLFAHKPAPIQVAWPAYPGMSGLRQMDYRLTDEHADPAGESERYYTETLARLPCGFACYAPDAEVSAPGAPPLLERGYVTFASFDELAKASDDALGLWAGVLAAVPDSRLMLDARELAVPSARQALLERFSRHGVAPERLVLAPPAPSGQPRLARYANADVVLDTFPCNGTTTTCEALYMGVPVVTLAGRTGASRLGASLLRRAGLPELVAGDAEAFAECARKLVLDRARLVSLRAGLRARLQASPLMDARGFAAGVERAYVEMHEAWQRRRQARGTGEALRLHIGGREVQEGWKILNAQAGTGVDFVGDCADLSRFADGSVDEIYASHVLEHLGYQAHLPRALREFCRVLRPGGAARISVPDFEVLCRQFLDPGATPEERFHCMRMAFGGQIDAFDFHHVGLTHEFLSRYLYEAGFSRVERVKRFGLFNDASELVVRGELISLNVVAYK